MALMESARFESNEFKQFEFAALLTIDFPDRPHRRLLQIHDRDKKEASVWIPILLLHLVIFGRSR